MSINAALANALSGLTTAARTAEVVAGNIANATNEGYRARELIQSAQSRAGSGGVASAGILRHSDPVVLAERRNIGAGVAGADVLAGFVGQMSGLFGTPGAAGTLGTLLTEFDSALVLAASQPEANSRLSLAVSRAVDVAARLNTMERDLRSMREMADQKLDVEVGRLNSLLQETHLLNKRLVTARGAEAASLLDQRDGLIDEIAALVPVRIMQRRNGAVALYSANGAALLDARPATVGFVRTPVIQPHMMRQNGLLSGLTVNGLPMSDDPPGGALSGGSLGALLTVRDVMAPQAQAQIDAVALDLAQRVQDPALDPTLAPADPGLFTDAGTRVTNADEIGLAGRLAVNGALTASTGGAAWRLRDGLGAGAPGPRGDNSLLVALSDALSDQRAPASASVPAANRSIHGLVGEVHTARVLILQEAERRQGFLTVQLDILRDRERAAGVDTDTELQRLLLVESSYAANARVIETVGQMLDSLLRI